MFIHLTIAPEPNRNPKEQKVNARNDIQKQFLFRIHSAIIISR